MESLQGATLFACLKHVPGISRLSVQHSFENDEITFFTRTGFRFKMMKSRFPLCWKTWMNYGRKKNWVDYLTPMFFFLSHVPGWFLPQVGLPWAASLEKKGGSYGVGDWWSSLFIRLLLGGGGGGERMLRCGDQPSNPESWCFQSIYNQPYHLLRHESRLSVR